MRPLSKNGVLGEAGVYSNSLHNYIKKIRVRTRFFLDGIFHGTCLIFISNLMNIKNKKYLYTIEWEQGNLKLIDLYG